MPGPSEDVPRWQPPARETPQRTDPWEPSAEVPRWDPDADAAPRPPAARTTVGARIESDAAERRPVERVPLAARPFRWWGAHPWAIAWVGVLLAPVGVLLLRFVDEYGYERFVAPLQWTLIALLALLLVRAMLFSARRSVGRLVLGLAAAGGALGLLLWPVTQITLGRVICPARAGADLGVQSAAVALEAWRRGEAGDAAWHAADPAPAWREKARAISLLDYRLVESGCFERVAPVDTHHTWHDFRVTIKEGERAPLSKVVVVHTAVEGDGWKITGIEGPLP
jgi:hypothetical protein